MARTRHSLVVLAAMAALTAAAPAVAGDSPQAPLPSVTAQRIVAIARAELARGVREVPAGSDRGTRIGMYVRSTSPSYYPAAWCAYFASWVTQRAGVPIGSRGRGIGRTADIATWARRTGRWHHTPKPSNLIVMAGHVGIVEKVFADHTLLSIDGNWSNRVTRVRRRWSEALGYVRVTPRSVPDPPLRARIEAVPGRVVSVGERVSFSSHGSHGDIGAYAWDLNGDGRFGDARGPSASRAYGAAGTVRVALRVSSRRGKVALKHLTVTVEAPAPPVVAPA